MSVWGGQIEGAQGVRNRLKGTVGEGVCITQHAYCGQFDSHRPRVRYDYLKVCLSLVFAAYFDDLDATDVPTGQHRSDEVYLVRALH